MLRKGIILKIIVDFIPEKEAYEGKPIKAAVTHYRATAAISYLSFLNFLCAKASKNYGLWTMLRDYNRAFVLKHQRTMD